MDALSIVKRQGPKVLIHLFLIPLCIVFIFPVFYIGFTAFKTEQDIFQSLSLIPSPFTLENWHAIFASGVRIFDYYRNSIIITACSVLLVILFASTAGYGFAKFEFPGKKAFFAVVTLIITFPLAALLIPLFIMEFKLKMYNTLLGLILPITATRLPLAIFIMMSFFVGVPDELREAAVIDGASQIQTFLKVMLPLAKNGYIVVSILTFQAVWGEYPLSRTLADNVRSLPLSVGLTYLKYEHWNFGIMSMILLIAIAPPIIFFFFFRKYTQYGINVGGIKG